MTEWKSTFQMEHYLNKNRSCDTFKTQQVMANHKTVQQYWNYP